MEPLQGEMIMMTSASSKGDCDCEVEIVSDQKHKITKLPSSTNFVFRAPQENFNIPDFELVKIYGVGSYSKVIIARKKDTGVIYALKIMDNKFIMKENKTAYVKMERIVLDQLNHPGIVQLCFTFQDAFSICKCYDNLRAKVMYY
ncbi:unnamed protein product [Rhodiola kirilowii]